MSIDVFIARNYGALLEQSRFYGQWYQDYLHDAYLDIVTSKKTLCELNDGDYENCIKTHMRATYNKNIRLRIASVEDGSKELDYAKAESDKQRQEAMLHKERMLSMVENLEKEIYQRYGAKFMRAYKLRYHEQLPIMDVMCICGMQMSTFYLRMNRTAALVRAKYGAM